MQLTCRLRSALKAAMQPRSQMGACGCRVHLAAATTPVRCKVVDSAGVLFNDFNQSQVPAGVVPSPIVPYQQLLQATNAGQLEPTGT